MKKYLLSIVILSAMLLAVGFGVASAQTIHTIQSGESLGSIANAYGTSVQAIVDANNLVNPNAIYAGDTLIIPDQPIAQAFAPQESTDSGNQESIQYIVQNGDTVSGIAARYGKTTAEIAAANGLYNVNAIYPGQILIIPGAYNGAAPVAPAPESTPEPPAAQPGTVTYQTHTVGYGDTIFGIAAAYGVDVNALMDVNDITNPNYIYVGQQINIPGTETQPVADASAPPADPAAETATPLPEGPWPTVTPTPLPVGPWPTEVPDVGVLPAEPTALPEGPWPTVTPTPLPVGPWPTAVPDGDAGNDTGGEDSAEATGDGQAENPAPAPQPTEAPLSAGVAVGGNLLANGGFENGHYNHNGLAELQVPNNWRFIWKEGESGFDQPFFRPETRVLSSAFLPPIEHEQFIYDGNFTMKVFKGYAPIDFSLETNVTLNPGVYEMTINIFPDLVEAYTDDGKVYSPSPSAGEAKLYSSVGDSGWMFPEFGERNEIKWRFRVTESGEFTVGANMRGRYGLLNNGFFLDNWSLFKVE